MKFLLVSLVFVAILTIGFLVYIGFGFDQNDNFDITGRVIYTDYIGDEIIIPIKVHLVEVEGSSLSTVRDEADMIRLFGKVNEIWEEANIYFSVEEIIYETISVETFRNSQNNLGIISLYTKTDEKYLDAYFMRFIGGPNGVALTHLNLIFVADITTVNDFRATSHEFGHILGLIHVPDASFLMARGKNGEFISDFEIEIARKNAFDLFV